MNAEQIREKLAELLAAAQLEHPGAEGFALGDAAVIMRRPTLTEYMACAAIVEKQQTGHLFKDPAKVTKPVLSLLVGGEDAARAELAERPQFVVDLYNLVNELAGSMDVEIEEAPELLADHPKAAQCLGFKICDVDVIVRKVDGFDWNRHRSNLAKMDTACEAVAQLAIDQLMEVPDKEGNRPKWDALVSRYPAAVIELGSELQRRTKSRAERIRGK